MFKFKIILSAVLTLALVCSLSVPAGIIPARRASRLDPIEAIYH
ncbi:hypothetical protein [Syntrophaceticus schinkii]|nr:hypothetical protein [Syntrophaceticus schinkii]